MTRAKKQPATSAGDDASRLKNLLPDVTPLAAHGRVLHAKPRRKPVPLERRDSRNVVPADDLSDHISGDFAAGEDFAYARAGLARQTLRKLRRGKWPVEAELDLHGSTSTEARALLVEFLDDCTRNDIRCVRIIHGKGLRSGSEPVLKTRVASWLAQRSEVLAFCQARPADGGGGAVMVLLKA